MRQVLWLGFAVIVGAAVGNLWGGALAFGEVSDNQYLSTGFHLNAARAFAGAALPTALKGAAIGGLLLLLGLAARAIRARLPGLHWLVPYAVSACAALLFVALQAQAFLAIKAARVWFDIALWLAWCAAFALGRHGRVQASAHLQTLRVFGLFALPAVGVVASVLEGELLRDLAMAPVAYLSAALTFAVLWAVVARLRPEGPGLPTPPWWCALTALPLIAAVAAPQVVAPGIAVERPVNVVLIAIDTLRVDDAFGTRPDGTPIAPELRKLAARGTRFDACIAQAPWTKPSFASILTGRYPREHGATTFETPLKATETMLSEMLREAGHRTLGVVSQEFLTKQHGFNQGYDQYDETYVRGEYEITSGDVTTRAIEIMKANEGAPYFMFAHYFDPHFTYRDHDAFAYGESYGGWLKGVDVGINALRDRRHDLDDADLGYLRALYHEDISYTDQQVGRLVDYISKSGHDKDTIIIVVSDHGEEFMERGWLGHTLTLHEELINVPLIIKLPDGDKQVQQVAATVEARSIPATVLDYMKVKGDRIMEGDGLLPLMRGETDSAPSPYAFSEAWLPKRNLSRRLCMVGVRTDRWKYVRNLTRDREALYDMETDPAERDNIVLTAVGQADRLKPVLERWMAKMEGMEVTEGELSDEQLSKLRALGYGR